MDLVDAFREEAVTTAVTRVASGRHAPGPDGVRSEHLVAWWDRNGDRIIKSALAGHYRPGTLWCMDSERLEGLVVFSECLHARVVSRLLLPVLYEAFEPVLRPQVLGFRPRANQYSKVRAAECFSHSTKQVASLTLEPFTEFDLPHALVLAMLTSYLPTAIVDLIGRFLARPIRRHGAFDRGLRRGLTLSPFLVNVAMNQILDPYAVSTGRRWLRYQSDLHLAFETLEVAEELPLIEVGDFLQGDWEIQDATEWLRQSPALFHFKSELLSRRTINTGRSGRRH